MLIALYDGHCRICTREARRLTHLAAPGAIEMRSFQDDGVLDAFPALTKEACMKALHVVAPDGTVYSGAEAIARLVARAPLWGWLAYGYYVPGVRFALDRAYAWVARNRYRWNAKDACEPNGTCHLHR
jgi:predicted DCC family thiol-disulfide oxidoreductase YuxK